MTDEHDKSQVQTDDIWPADQLREYQAGITKLANSIRKDITESDGQTAFSITDADTLRAAAGILQRFEYMVTHGGSPVSPYQQQDEARNKAFSQAIELARKIFPASQNRVIHAAKLALAIEARISQTEVRNTPNPVIAKIERALKQDDLVTLSSMIYQCYIDQTAQLANAFLDIGGKYINNRYVDDWALRVRKAVDNPEPTEKNILNALEQYLADHKA